MRQDDLEPVFETKDAAEALLYRTALEEAGIDVVERVLEYELLGGVRQLLVRTEDAERARALTSAFEQEADQGHLKVDDAAALAEPAPDDAECP